MKKEKKDIIDKCTLCGLRSTYYSTDRDHDKKIVQTRKLYDAGIINTKLVREINCGIGTGQDPTRYCAIGNHRKWKKPLKQCPYWIFNGDKSLKLSDYLAIYHTMYNTRLATKIGICALLFAAASTVVAIVAL